MDDAYFDSLMTEEFAPPIDDSVIEALESDIEMLAPGGEPTQQDALQEALRFGPVMAGDWWDTPLELVEPAFVPVPGGKPLLYPGKSHVFIGEPGRGKTMFAQHALVEEAAAGRCSIFIDLEKGFDSFRERVRALGATKDTAGRMGYWRLTRGLSAPAIDRIVQFAQEWGVQCVVIDSVGRALSRASLDENNNDHVRQWYDTVVEPMLRAGLTVVLIDHFKKPSEGGPRGGSGHGRYAKGAGSKLDVIDGAAYGVTNISPFSRDKAGRMKVSCAKDNNGTRAEDEVVCEVEITPIDGGRTIEFKPTAPRVSHTPQGKIRRTWYMEEVSKFLEGQEGSVAKDTIRQAIGRNRGYVTSAIDTLVEEGFAAEEDGKRNSKQISSVKPYRMADDELATGDDPF
jgi:hypothetical protein